MAINLGRITVMAISPGLITVMVIRPGRIMVMAISTGRIMIMGITTGRTRPRAAMEKSSFSTPLSATRRRPLITRRRRAITRRHLIRAMAITGGPAFRSILGSEVRRN